MFLKSLSLSLFFLSLTTSGVSGTPPKLVVVISIDQFRYDYLTRFRQHFGEKGFNLLLEHGAVFANATYKHALNMTGPGHATISTGSYGNQNGIIANEWYDRSLRKAVPCVGDPNIHGVGASTGSSSPRFILGSTVGDVLRLDSSFRSKVIAISLKTTAANMLGGHLATGVYWLEDSVFATSSYYRESLPEWVKEFNNSGYISSFFGRQWERILPDSEYASMDDDNAPYESESNGLGRTFPHPIIGKDHSRRTGSYYSALRSSPFGNEVLLEFAKRAVLSESLGKRNVPDLLCIGFSSNDHVGHLFGPNSHEVLDITVRTDRVIEELLAFIDNEIGLEQTVVVLTSDHGVAPIPEYVLAHQENMKAGRIHGQAIIDRGNAILEKAYGRFRGDLPWVEYLGDGNLYLHRDAISFRKLSVHDVAARLVDSMKTWDGFAVALPAKEVEALVPSSPIEVRIKHSYHPIRSGDIIFALQPYFIDQSGETGTTHGQPYEYDAHVPVIFFGGGIARGTHYSDASPADIAPTLSVLLGIGFPSGREGRVLVEAFR